MTKMKDFLRDYRHEVLSWNKNSREYAGTANVFDSESRPKFRITYRKKLTGTHGLEREDDRPLVEIRYDKITRDPITFYHTYLYDQYGFTDGKEEFSGITDGALLVDAHYSFLIPKLMFLRGVCFGERVDDRILKRVLQETEATKYERPVNFKSIKELKLGDKINIISKSSQESELNLSALYSGDYQVVKSKTPQDKIDEILLKQDFEGLIPEGIYTVEHIPVKLINNAYGTLLTIGTRHPFFTSAVGGVEALIFLKLLLMKNSQIIKNSFGSYSEFKQGVDKKIEIETEIAQHLTDTGRFAEDFDEYSKDVTYWRKLLLETVKDIYKS